MDNTPRVDQDEGLVGPFNEAAACYLVYTLEDFTQAWQRKTDGCFPPRVADAVRGRAGRARGLRAGGAVGAAGRAAPTAR